MDESEMDLQRKAIESLIRDAALWKKQRDRELRSTQIAQFSLNKNYLKNLLTRNESYNDRLKKAMVSKPKSNYKEFLLNEDEPSTSKNTGKRKMSSKTTRSDSRERNVEKLKKHRRSSSKDSSGTSSSSTTSSDSSIEVIITKKPKRRKKSRRSKRRRSSTSSANSYSSIKRKIKRSIAASKDLMAPRKSKSKKYKSHHQTSSDWCESDGTMKESSTVAQIKEIRAPSPQLSDKTSKLKLDTIKQKPDFETKEKKCTENTALIQTIETTLIHKIQEIQKELDATGKRGTHEELVIKPGESPRIVDVQSKMKKIISERVTEKKTISKNKKHKRSLLDSNKITHSNGDKDENDVDKTPLDIIFESKGITSRQKLKQERKMLSSEKSSQKVTSENKKSRELDNDKKDKSSKKDNKDDELSQNESKLEHIHTKSEIEKTQMIINKQPWFSSEKDGKSHKSDHKLSSEMIEKIHKKVKDKSQKFSLATDSDESVIKVVQSQEKPEKSKEKSPEKIIPEVKMQEKNDIACDNNIRDELLQKASSVILAEETRQKKKLEKQIEESQPPTKKQQSIETMELATDQNIIDFSEPSTSKVCFSINKNNNKTVKQSEAFLENDPATSSERSGANKSRSQKHTKKDKIRKKSRRSSSSVKIVSPTTPSTKDSYRSTSRHHRKDSRSKSSSRRKYRDSSSSSRYTRRKSRSSSNYRSYTRSSDRTRKKYRPRSRSFSGSRSSKRNLKRYRSSSRDSRSYSRAPKRNYYRNTSRGSRHSRGSRRSRGSSYSSRNWYSSDRSKYRSSRSFSRSRSKKYSRSSSSDRSRRRRSISFYVYSNPEKARKYYRRSSSSSLSRSERSYKKYNGK